jgi:potassium-transporting ATPase ATP-binding subunit
MTSQTQATSAGSLGNFNRELILAAMADAFRKLSPRIQFRNPVMFVVFVCSVLTSLLWMQSLAGHGEAPTGFIFWVSLWLWFTLLFANFAEALAEGRGKAQADALRSSRKDVIAKKLASAHRDAAIIFTPSSELRTGHHVLVEAGEQLPGDGEVVVGAASVDQRGHGRHARAVGLVGGAHHQQSGR